MTYQMKMMDERMAGMREGEQKGMQIGMKAGRQEGRQEGWQEARVESIHAVMASLGCDSTKAMDVLNIPASEQPMYATLLERQ